MQKIPSFEKFIDHAQRRKQDDHEYNKVFDTIDLTNDNSKHARKTCEGKFLMKVKQHLNKKSLNFL